MAADVVSDTGAMCHRAARSSVFVFSSGAIIAAYSLGLGVLREKRGTLGIVATRR